MDDEELRKAVTDFAGRAAVRLRNSTPKTCDLAVRVTVDIISHSGRVGSKTQKEMLKAMLAEGNGAAWYNGPGKYLFEFQNDKFMWGNRDLYLTAGEKLALYKRLIRDEAMDRMTTSRLRKKFGKDFLEGFI